MFVDQRLQTDVGQNVTAVGDERFVPQLGFNIFDSTTGFEQNRFVDKVKLDSGIAVLRKCFGKSLRQPMRINEKFIYPHVDQMIEWESNERLLKNRHQRFGQTLGERAKPRS